MAGFEQCLELLSAGDLDGLQRLLALEPECAEGRDSNGVSLVMLALYRGRPDLAQAVALKKKDLDIFEAAALGRTDRIKQLTGSGSDRGPTGGRAAVNERSGDGCSALHFAGFFGQGEAARVLIAAGAAVDAVSANPMKVMPLHSAASARNLEAVRCLLEHGAPVNARQAGGWVPVHCRSPKLNRPEVIDFSIA